MKALRNAAALLVAILGFLLGSGSSLSGKDLPGVIIYVDPPGSPDALAASIEFLTADEHGHVVNVKPTDGRARRLMTDQVEGIVRFQVLESLTVADSKAFQNLKDELRSIEQLTMRFPTHARKWAAYQQELTGVVNKVQSGFAMVRGQWIPIESYMKSHQAPEKLAGEINFEGKVYTGIRISGVQGTEVGIMHSGGAARLPISSLDRATISFLNDGKVPPPIKPERVEISRLKEQLSELPSAESGAPLEGYNEDMAQISQKLRASAKSAADSLRQQAAEIRARVESEKALVEELRREMGTLVTFRVLQKLQGWGFSSLREIYGDNLYEIRFGDGESAIIVCPFTEFLTTGIAEMYLVPVEEVEVKMFNGFVKNSMIYRESKPVDLDQLTVDYDLLRNVDKLNNAAERLELEAEERIKNLERIFASLDVAMIGSRIRTDKVTASAVPRWRVSDESLKELQEKLGNADIPGVLEMCGMDPNSDLASTDVFDRFLEGLASLEFDVTFDVEKNASVYLFVCRLSAIDNPEMSLANAAGWIAQKEEVFLSGASKTLKIPLLLNEVFLIPRKALGTDSDDTRELLNGMISLATAEPEMNVPPQKVLQFLRDRAPQAMDFAMSEKN